MFILLGFRESDHIKRMKILVILIFRIITKPLSEFCFLLKVVTPSNVVTPTYVVTPTNVVNFQR